VKTVASYFIVNTLMLGVCGVYDLFWWSILGEMLDLDKNPAKILGVGLSGGIFTIIILPPLPKQSTTYKIFD